MSSNSFKVPGLTHYLPTIISNHVGPPTCGCSHVCLCADLCVTLHLWLASLYSHYLNSRVMLYQTVGRGSRKIPLKQLGIRGPVRLSETEIATDAECWERRCGFRGRRPVGGKGMRPFSLPWDQDIPFPGMLLCQEMRGKKNNLCQQLLC